MDCQGHYTGRTPSSGVLIRWQKRLFRQLAWRFSRKHCAGPKDSFERLPFRYLKHTSKLIRKLGNSDLAPRRHWLLEARVKKTHDQ